MDRLLDFPRGTARLIRADGTISTVPGIPSIARLHELIGAETLDVVRVGRVVPNDVVMYVDDLGIKFRRTINEEATKLYLAICIPGATGKILGDVVLVHDEDLA